MTTTKTNNGETFGVLENRLERVIGLIGDMEDASLDEVMDAVAIVRDALQSMKNGVDVYDALEQAEQEMAEERERL
jgi:hypothetical protein